MVLDNPIQAKLSQNHLAENIFPEKKRAANSQIQTEPAQGDTCVSDYLPGLGWADALRDGRRKDKLWDYLIGQK